MRMKRMIIPALAAAALTLSGCVVLRFLPDTISGEQISKRWVQLDFGVCVASAQNGVCVPSGTGEPHDDRLGLIAIRAPKKTGMPYELRSVSGMPVALTHTSAYTQQLNELAPRGPHERWIGYRPTSGTGQEIVDTYFEVQMHVPRDFAREEFPVTPAVGIALNPAVEVNCGTDAFQPTSTCITDPFYKENLEKIRIPLTLKR
jgi:hypothetical protein